MPTMEMEIKSSLIHDAEGLETFRSLLKTVGLPYEDLTLDGHILLGYFDHEEIIGTGALEIYGDYALLRSLAVNNKLRGKSLGSRITDDLIDQAKKNNIKNIYLLTESAKLFFKRKGFNDISRENVPAEVKSSTEFSEICSDTAVCMEYTC